MGCFSSADVRQLLHNKYVAVLGDSIQRSVYKDIVKLLQVDELLTENQLRAKGEMSFANDTLVEGGSLSEMHNGTNYREVRQYRTGHHLVRFYFLTRVYSEYVESVLADFKEGPMPDVVLVNSCIWDLLRYDNKPLEAYKKNLDCLFSRLSEVLSPECLVIWNMTMPVGFKAGEMPQYSKHNLRWDIVEGNFYSATLANLHKMDVLDMHYYFRFDMHNRCKDATHWDKTAHRKYSQILMTHIADAWGVEPPEPTIVKFPLWNLPPPHPLYNDQENGHHHFVEAQEMNMTVPLWNVPPPHPLYNDQENGHHHFGMSFRCIKVEAQEVNMTGHPNEIGLPLVPLWNVPPPHPQYNDQENGHHHFVEAQEVNMSGRPIQSKPPHGDLLRNVPYPQPPYAQESIRHCFEPSYLPGYTAFDGTDSGTFIPEPMGFHPNRMNSKVLSPFVDDNPFLVNDFPPRNAGFDGFVPTSDHPFNGMTINSYNLAVPDDFGAFPYNAPMPQATWRGYQRVHKKRRGIKPMYPYHVPSPSPSRI